MILPIEHLEHHHLLVPLETVLDMLYARLQLFFDIPLLFLHDVSTSVKRQQQKIHGKAEDHYRTARILKEIIRSTENIFKKNLQRHDKQV